MDFDYTFIPRVYDLFKRDWKCSKEFYSEFIKSKDFGIETNHTLKETEMQNGNEQLYTDYYKIVDEKKWLLTKLKYGF